MIGPEFRQYWFLNDKEGRPIDRDTQEAIAKAGKYANTVIGFGSKKDFSLTSFYLTNSMFPLNVNELSVDNKRPYQSYTYQILNESVASIKEKRNQVQLHPWHLSDENQIIIGKDRKYPFHVKDLIGGLSNELWCFIKKCSKGISTRSRHKWRQLYEYR
ncbi:hypothetical protein [Pseudogracilibacillus sp. SO30301A]|uniref:hypothetical protein n=1 Tax=Pseudogracilibacillus sp. SO30301A TaxID=3098291 RepID=UPI00300DCF5B